MGDVADGFVGALESYFGPWRGQTGREIAAWVRHKNIPHRRLQAVYRELRDTHKVEPVNTVSIADIREILIRQAEVPSDAPQLVSPDDEENYLSRSEAVARLSELLRMITGGGK